MGLHSSLSALPVLMVVVFLPFVTATENCAFKTHKDCRCVTDPQSHISIECNTENISLIKQIIRVPKWKIVKLELFKLTISTKKPLRLSENFFYGIKSVHNILMKNCSLDEIPKEIHHLQNVSYLDLSHNNIEILKRSFYNHSNAMQGLQGLNLASNKLTEIPNLKSFSLKNLDLSHNRISSIKTETLSLAPNVEVLNCSSNNISSLFVGCFKSLEKLKHLDLSANNLHSITAYTFLTNSELKSLDLSQNKLFYLHTDTFTGLEVSLEKLLIQGNEIKNIENDTFIGISHLTMLDISQNGGLQDITKVNYPQNLEYLDFSQCDILKLNECKFLSLTNLSVLKLAGNKLPCDCQTWRLEKWYNGKWKKRKANYQEADWLCLDDSGKAGPITDLPEHCFNNCYTEKLDEKYIQKLSIDIDRKHETILSQWKIYNNSLIYGFVIHVESVKHDPIHSPLIHKDAREFEFRMEMLSVKEFTLCLEVLDDNALIIEKMCQTKAIPINTLHVVTGIVAGVIFLVPCYIFLFYIIYNDRQFSSEFVTEEEENSEYKKSKKNSKVKTPIDIRVKCHIRNNFHEDANSEDDSVKINTKDMPVGIKPFGENLDTDKLICAFS